MRKQSVTAPRLLQAIKRYKNAYKVLPTPRLLAEVFECTIHTIYNKMSILEREGKIKREGEKYKTKYSLTKK